MNKSSYNVLELWFCK